MANPKQHGPRTFTLKGGRGMLPTNNLPSRPGHKIEGYKEGLELGRKVAGQEEFDLGFRLGAKLAADVPPQAPAPANPLFEIAQARAAQLIPGGTPEELQAEALQLSGQPAFRAGAQAALREGLPPDQAAARAHQLSQDPGFAHQVNQADRDHQLTYNNALQAVDTATFPILPMALKYPLDFVTNGMAARGSAAPVDDQTLTRAMNSEGAAPTFGQQLAEARGEPSGALPVALGKQMVNRALGGTSSAASGTMAPGMTGFNAAYQPAAMAYGAAQQATDQALEGGTPGDLAPAPKGSWTEKADQVAAALPGVAAGGAAAVAAGYPVYRGAKALVNQVVQRTPTGEIPALNQVARGAGQALQRIPGAGTVGQLATRAGQAVAQTPLIGQPLARLGQAALANAPRFIGTAARLAGPLAVAGGAAMDTVGSAIDSQTDEGNEAMARRGALSRLAGPAGVGEGALRAGLGMIGSPRQFSDTVWDNALAKGNVGRVGDALGLEKLKSMQERSNDIANDLQNGSGPSADFYQQSYRMSPQEAQEAARASEGSEFQNRFNQIREKYEANVPVTNFQADPTTGVSANEARKQWIDQVATQAAHQQGQRAWAAQRSEDQGGTGAYFRRVAPTQSPNGTPAGRLQGMLAQDLGGKPEEWQDAAQKIHAPGHYQGDDKAPLQPGEAMAYRAPAYGTSPTLGQAHQLAQMNATKETWQQEDLAANREHQPAPRPLALQHPAVTQAVPPVTGGLFHPQAQLPAPQVAAKPAFQPPAPTAFKLPGPAPIKS